MITGKVQAQSTQSSTPAPKEWRISVGPEFGVPIGQFSNAYNWNFGGSVQVDIPIVEKLYVTVNAGYNDFFAKKAFSDLGGSDFKLVPVKAGVKYFVLGNLGYVQGEGGFSFLTNKSDLNADKSGAVTFAPQIGVLLPLAKKNYLDVGFRWEQTATFYDGGNSSNFLGLRVAYSFGL